MEIAGSVRRPDGARIRFQLQGPRGAPTLLLLQGQANHHGWWDPLRADFSSDYLTVTLDYRGTGESSMLTSPSARGEQWSTVSFAHDVAAVLHGVGAEAAHVYATSMGGRVAQHLAVEHPELVRSLVLSCTSPGGAIAVERDAEVRRALATGSRAERRRAMVDLFYRPAWVTKHGGYDGVTAALLGDPTMVPGARVGHLRTSDRHDASAVLGRIAAPTLVLHGEDDRMTPVDNAEILAARIPGAEIRTFADGRHGFFHEMSDVVTPAVLAHLQRHG